MPSPLRFFARNPLLAVGGVVALLILGLCGIAIGAADRPDGVDDDPAVTVATTEPAQAVSAAPATTAPPVAAPPTSAVAPPPVTNPTTPGRVRTTTGAAGVYYANCAEVRAAGAAPLYRGQPGYRSGLDRDGDGVACES